MYRKWGFLVLGTMVAAAVVGTSAGARTQTNVLPPAHISANALVKKILASHGIDPKGVVVQHGVWNYAGPSCPGFGWTCTTAKRVIQFGMKDSNNQFQCSASYPGSGFSNGTDTCEIVQVSTGGDNNAQCVEQTGDTTGVSQSCEIDQSNTTGGDNHAQVTQQVNAQGGPAQDATQNAEVSQTTILGGKNDAHVDQTINQQTNDSGSGGTQSQEGDQTASVGQTSDSGDNHAHVNQSLNQQEQIAPAGGKNAPVQSIDQTQNATDSGNPNLNAAIYQTSNSGGNNDGNLSQSINQNANAPGKNVTGSQTQGSPDGGVNGHFDQSSTGLSNAHGTQQEHQNLGGDKSNLTQRQYDPAWMGSPQGTNPNDNYNIDQHTDQHGSNNANQTDDVYSNCDTTGTCTAHEDLNQNGNHQTNSCTGSDCHIGTTCTSGGEEAGCFPVGECDGDCGSPPPPPPRPTSCEIEDC